MSSYEIPFDEQNEIVRTFPSDIKFSYEKGTHKKVLSDICVIIPKGRKYFAWFTHRNRKNVCIFLEVDGHNHKITNMFYRHVSFDDSLSFGTIFYGTLFRTSADIAAGIHDNEIFSVENIHYYRGKNIEQCCFGDKLNLIKTIFDTSLRYNIRFFKKSIVFGLPIITTSFMDAYDSIKKLPYSVYSIQYRYLDRGCGAEGAAGATGSQLEKSGIIEYYHYVKKDSDDNNNNSNNSNNRNNNSVVDKKQSLPLTTSIMAPAPVPVQSSTSPIKIYIREKTNNGGNSVSNNGVNEISKIFFVKPDLQNDIYYLYNMNAVNFTVISNELAHIPDYKTSVLMNKLFRNIKENTNLDYLEESDEEEEFENIQIDKFVDLNKTIKMRCIFNTRFRKWVPVNVV